MELLGSRWAVMGSGRRFNPHGMRWPEVVKSRGEKERRKKKKKKKKTKKKKKNRNDLGGPRDDLQRPSHHGIAGRSMKSRGKNGPVCQKELLRRCKILRGRGHREPGNAPCWEEEKVGEAAGPRGWLALSRLRFERKSPRIGKRLSFLGAGKHLSLSF